MSERTLYISFWLISVAKISSLMVVDDPDLWGHLLYGLEHLTTGILPRVDHFSYTAANERWINHEWLCEWLFAISWKGAGAVGLWALRLALTGATLGVVFWLVSASTTGIYAGLLVFMVSWPEIAKGFSFRPQLFSFLFFSLLLFIIHHLRKQCRTSPLLLLLLVFIMGLWANLHGGFLVGLGLLSWFFINLVVDKLCHGLKPKFYFMTLFAITLAWVATFLNPYGADLWSWLFRSLVVSRAENITEWYSLFRGGLQLTVISYCVLISIIIFLFFTTNKKRTLFEWGLLAGLCVASFFNIRLGVFLGLAAVIILPGHLESVFPLLSSQRGFHRHFVSAVMVFSVIFALGIHMLPGHRPNRIIVETSEHPVNTYRFIHENGLSGNIVVWFNWAQSTLWYLNETCRVAFDGRFRTVYPKKIEEDYFHFNNMDDQWENLINNYDTQIILMPGAWPGIEILLRRGDWVLASSSMNKGILQEQDCCSEGAVLLIRRGLFTDFEGRLEKNALNPLQRKKDVLFGAPL